VAAPIPRLTPATSATLDFVDVLIALLLDIETLDL
jgi:hypothetical protein